MNYEPVIGVEIHVQLRTRTKMFCGCALSFGDEPNTHVCPVCLGHPGTLPVTNAEAVHYGLMIAMAFDCEIAPRSIFHRKNYFYPDLPKGYQISQYDIPLGRNGRLGDVRIHRVHLEEDAAKLIHTGSSGRIHGAETSVVDFNRGGTPLVEIVTEPDLRSPGEAADFGRLLQATLRRMGVSDVNMEEGSLRMDANVSIRPAGTDDARHEDRAEEHELVPLPGARDRGGDRAPGADRARRRRGRAGDAPLRPAVGLAHLAPLEGGGARLPLLPGARPGADRAHRGDAGAAPAARCQSCRPRAPSGSSASWSCPPRRRACSRSAPTGATSSRTRSRSRTDLAQNVANWVTNELAARIDDRDPGLDASSSRRRSRELVDAGRAEADLGQRRPRGAGRAARAEGGEPVAVVEPKGLGSADSGELESIVDQAIADNPDAVEKIRAGKGQAIGAIVGAVMRETKGRADGGEVQRMIQERLGG